jgi:putative ABC transport system substrate-binding protein
MARVPRRGFLTAALALLAAPRNVPAQPGRARRIGYLVLVPLTDPPSRERQAFLDGLRELGYAPGGTLEIVYRSAEGDPEFLASACEDLVARKVEVIVASGPYATLAAKRAAGTIPIVMQAVGDPVGIGAVRSLARPEANVTGVSFISSDLAPKRVQLIKDVAPRTRRMAVLFDVRNPNARAEASAALQAAARLGLATEGIALASGADLTVALDRWRQSKPDALYVVFEEGIVVDNRSTIAEFGLRQRVAVVSGWSSLTEAGALLSYAPDLAAIFRRSAHYVHRILAGAKPADLPIEMASTMELVINARTAKALGIEIPPALSVRANRIVE